MLMRGATSLAALVGAELSAVVLLIRLGPYVSSPPGWHGAGHWLAETPPEDALVAAVRLLAMAIAWWLTASTVLYAVARATRVPALARGVRWVTLPPLRRMIDGVLATTIIASSTFGGGRMAVAEPVRVGPVVLQLDQQSDPPVVATNPAYQPRPAGNGAVRAEPAARAPTPEAPPISASTTTSSTTTTRPRKQPPPAPVSVPKPDTAKATSAATYLVQPGDNFWKIAQHELAKATGRPAEALNAKEVGRYWIQLVEKNRHTIRSGNPNLIYPGEAITLLTSAPRAAHGAG
ncbi:MAG TPA: hypothetical protein VM142_11230 [Acidimicrobiales bacterium]|nr:hypothetical protein [Acidimicrobiales bacterium]